MTSPPRFEQDLPPLLVDLYVTGTPDYRDDLVQQIVRTPQRPAWAFLERWFPVDVVTQRVSTPRAPWRAIGAVALIALLIVAAVSVYVGTQRRLPPPFGLARNGLIVYSDNGDIVARDAVSGSPRVLVGGPSTDESPQFAPLGDELLFLRRLDSSSAEIMVASTDGSDPAVLAGPMAPPDSWDWAPAGDAIVIGHDGTPGLTLIPTDGSPQVTLPSPTQTGPALFRPPHGDQILLRGSDADGVPGLYLVQRNGAEAVRLDLSSSGDPDHDFAHGYAWSEDGSRLAYVLVAQHPTSGVGSGLRIHVADIDPDGLVTADHPFEFAAGADNELNPMFVPESDRLIFQTREGDEDYLSIAPLSAPASATRLPGLSSTSGGGIGYQLEPDGKGLMAFLWDERATWHYDLMTKQATQVELGANDVATIQRLAP